MIIYRLKDMAEISALPKGFVVALGFFDGVHLGHRFIIDTARREATARNTSVAVWTISSESGGYKTGSLSLTDERERMELLHFAGADYAVICSFNEIRELSGEDFVSRIIDGVCHASAVVCGYNFRFGHRAAWGVSQLRNISEDFGIDTVAVDAVTDDKGVVVSSTRIRSLISDGDVAEADLLLGRPYSFMSKVIRGKMLGRRLGFPTANQLIPKGKLTPKLGVYAVSVELTENGKRHVFPGAANIGYCPTLTSQTLDEAGVSQIDQTCEGVASEGHAVCETYIVGYSGDLYGCDVKISFLRRLRGEIKFDGIDSLMSRVKRDAVLADVIFREIYGD